MPVSPFPHLSPESAEVLSVFLAAASNRISSRVARLIPIVVPGVSFRVFEELTKDFRQTAERSRPVTPWRRRWFRSSVAPAISPFGDCLLVKRYCRRETCLGERNFFHLLRLELANRNCAGPGKQLKDGTWAIIYRVGIVWESKPQCSLQVNTLTFRIDWVWYKANCAVLFPNPPRSLALRELPDNLIWAVKSACFQIPKWAVSQLGFCILQRHADKDTTIGQ